MSDTLTLRQRQKLRLKAWNARKSHMDIVTARKSFDGVIQSTDVVQEPSERSREKTVSDKREIPTRLNLNQEEGKSSEEANVSVLDSVALIKSSYRQRQRKEEQVVHQKTIARRKKKGKKVTKKTPQATPPEPVVLSPYGLELKDLEYSKICCDFEYEAHVLKSIRNTLIQGQQVLISQTYDCTNESSISEARLLLQHLSMKSMSHCAIDQSVIPEIRNSGNAILILRPPEG